MTINRIMDLNESALTVVELFPLKPALTSTVASLQGSELDTPHCLFVKKNSDAHNLIVGTSRAKNNIENLKFCFERDVDDITIKPLSNTKIFVQKKNTFANKKWISRTIIIYNGHFQFGNNWLGS